MDTPPDKATGKKWYDSSCSYCCKPANYMGVIVYHGLLDLRRVRELPLPQIQSEQAKFWSMKQNDSVPKFACPNYPIHAQDISDIQGAVLVVDPRVGFQDREAFGAAANCDRSIVFESPRFTVSFHHFGKRKLASVWSRIQQLQEYLLYITCLLPGIQLFLQDQFRRSCVV